MNSQINWHRRWLVAVIVCFVSGALAVESLAVKEARPAHRWAVKIEKPGLPNLHQVSGSVYRGAQPTAEGIHQLEKMGIKTVVNLRSSHDDKDIVPNPKLTYHRIPMRAWNPTEEEGLAFLSVITDKSRLPAMVHCQHGADRTGVMIALYRVAVEGWSKQEAIDEMLKGGFGFHGIWESKMVGYLHKLDIPALKKKISRPATR